MSRRKGPGVGAVALLAIGLLLLLLAGLAQAKIVFNSSTGSIGFNTAWVGRTAIASGGNLGAGTAGREMQRGGC